VMCVFFSIQVSVSTVLTANICPGRIVMLNLLEVISFRGINVLVIREYTVPGGLGPLHLLWSAYFSISTIRQGWSLQPQKLSIWLSIVEDR
jgi:hypothetical protein